MEIKIFKLKLKNFKGIKDLIINFEGKNINIYGANATGKTTVFDAFKWLFFDKDSSDRKDFNIKTLNQDNKPIHFLEHEVEGTLIIDGQDIIFRKMLQEKWVKKRGQEQQEFSGHETSYWIDEVPVKKKDYEEKINNIIPENLFKLITDPLFFNNQMSWKERRELLINISGANITDENILDSNSNFRTLKENLQGRKIEDYKKVVAAKIKELNEEKEKIPIRIDELSSTIVTDHSINYEELEMSKNRYENEIDKIEKTLSDVQARQEDNMKKVNYLTSLKNELHTIELHLKVENENNNSSEKIKYNNKKAELESNIRNLQYELQERHTQLEKDKERRKELYQEWDKIQAEVLSIDAIEEICPTCQQKLLTETVEQHKKELQDNFEKQKVKRKSEINEEGKTISTRIADYENSIKTLNESLEECTKDLSVINEKIEELKEKEKNVQAFDVTQIKEYQSKAKEIEDAQKIVDKIEEEDIAELLQQKKNTQGQVNEIQEKLNQKAVQQSINNRILELEKQEEEISQKISELEQQVFLTEEFTKTKVEMLEAAINNNFEIVRFRLFDTQINGGLVECCDAVVNGVPYMDVNNAHKILAGLDIIRTLSKFYNITAPIFIDNAESINELSITEAQIISLVVTLNDYSLRIEAEK